MAALPEIGAHVAGYRIERQIGRGGMGVVYLAEQVRLRRHVALKLIVPELAEDEEFRSRFERESQLAASIDHPNVIPVYEAGDADGILYISMRYVEGSDLRRLIRREGRIDQARAAWITAQVAAALDAAHAAGLVHRDVKPANVLVTGPLGSEHAYLTDFGLTKHVSSHSGLTHTGQWVGTLDYVAPEQISGGALDARVDIYSLGCVLFESLTGTVPYPRDSEVAKMYAHLHEPPPPVSRFAPEVAPAFDAVIARALAKLVGNRFPSAGDLGRAGLAAAEGSPNTVPERSVAAGAAALLPQTRQGVTPGGEPPVTGEAPAAQAPAAPPGQPLVPSGQPPPAPTLREPVPPPYDTGATGQLPRSYGHPQPPYQPGAPRAPQPRPSRVPWVIAGIVLLALAGGAAALVASGVLSGKSRATTVIVRTRTQTVTGQNGGGGGGGSTSGGGGTSGSATFNGNFYTASYPAGWSVVEQDAPTSNYTETKFQAPDGSATVLIDRTPGAPRNPALEAAGVRSHTSATPGYQELVFLPIALGGRRAQEWEFSLPSGGRVDYFFNANGGRYAVLGEGPDSVTAVREARKTAASVAGQ